jgi:hypothetical protein
MRSRRVSASCPSAGSPVARGAADHASRGSMEPIEQVSLGRRRQRDGRRLASISRHRQRHPRPIVVIQAESSLRVLPIAPR